ncbi:integrator complex subunit 10-like [Littorina saxatilis]|uniref:Integrator complex subunit 10 n=1 Tax=Littorina saxatilis TaxID=31220 RepID=A0AAN9BXL8_9CAEN
MATAGMMDSLSDVDYLVMRARQYAKTDQYASKAWLITAKSLFPSSFVIQFESYQVEKASKNVNEAAKHLEEMFRNFPHERQLWEEVQGMLEALQTDSSEHQHTLLTEIFAAIPTHVQCQMLLTVAEKISNTLERCRLLLLAMRNFPSLVQEHGLKLIELLMNEEKRVSSMPPVNCYRKLLVCDAMPLVLGRDVRINLTPAQLYQWLQLAIEFYISYITQPASGEGTSSGADMLSPSKASLSRLPPVAGLLERENQVIDPWGSLFRLLVLVGQRLGWEFEPDIFNKPRDTQWQYLVSQYNRAKQTHSDSGLKQVLYMAVVMFMQSFYLYVSHIDTDISGTGLGSQHIPIVLVEGFPLDTEEYAPLPRAKKHKADNSAQPPILPSSNIPNSQALLSNFTMALKCYELLNTREELHKDFLSLYSRWKKETWAWISHLQIDVALYQGNFQEAAAQLQNCIDTATGRMKTRYALQRASCFYCLRNYAKACELILDILYTIPEQEMPEFEQAEKVATPSGSSRHLLMLQCTEKEFLPYCVLMLAACLKERMCSDHCPDVVLAHLIILLQYDWPQQEHLFSAIIRRIQQQGSFTYNMFFSYIFVVDMLEEFAYLDTVEGGRISLDILPVSTKQLAQQRTMTRGVNKGVKEDFRAALEKQVGRLQETCPKIIRNFLRDERTVFLQHI